MAKMTWQNMGRVVDEAKTRQLLSPAKREQVVKRSAIKRSVFGSALIITLCMVAIATN